LASHLVTPKDIAIKMREGTSGTQLYHGANFHVTTQKRQLQQMIIRQNVRRIKISVPLHGKVSIFAPFQHYAHPEFPFINQSKYHLYTDI